MLVIAVRRDRKLRWTAQLDPTSTTDPEPQRPPIRGLGPPELRVVYQPIVELATGKVRAHEALVRCELEPYRNPTELFREAVAQGAVGRLGRSIRHITFEQAPESNLFINIHPEELESRWLVRPDDPLCMHRPQVHLEITESAAFDYFDLCQNVLKEICARTGAHLVIDDFGAGYSNLKRVIDLEPHIVKLDRALITDIDRNPRQRILVEQLVRTCNALGAKLVAEGIETEGELHAVRDAGVELGQGYLMARPAYPIPSVDWPP